MGESNALYGSGREGLSRSEKLLDITHCSHQGRFDVRGLGGGGQEDEKVLGAGHVGEKPAVEAAMKWAARSGTRRSLGAKVKEF